MVISCLVPPVWNSGSVVRLHLSVFFFCRAGELSGPDQFSPAVSKLLLWYIGRRPSRGRWYGYSSIGSSLDRGLW